MVIFISEWYNGAEDRQADLGSHCNNAPTLPVCYGESDRHKRLLKNIFVPTLNYDYVLLVMTWGQYVLQLILKRESGWEEKV